MKKKIIGILLALFTLSISANVQAEEQTSNFIDLNNLCVKKEDNKLGVKFKLLKNMTLNNQTERINLLIRNVNNEQFGGSCSDGKCETDGLKIVTSTTCSANKEEGTIVEENTALTSGMTIAQFYEMQNESFTTTDILVEIFLQDKNYDYETIIYNTKENKVESIEKGHDVLNELIDKVIPQKYPDWQAYGGGGDEEGFSMSFRNINFKEVEIFKTITIKDWDKKTLEEMLEEVKPVFENNEVELYVGETGVTKDTLEAFKQSGYIANISTYNDENKLLYTWTFDGSKIENTDLNINLNINVGKSTNKEKIENLISKNRKSVVLEFAYHGILPTGTKVKVNVEEQFKNGKKLTLYYYNENGKLEEAAKNLEVKNGFVEFALEHCSEYVLVENTNNAQTGTLNVFLHSGLAVVSLVGIGYLFVSKKKNI